ncbi:pentatricopeptide repeat-containing protein 2, mitochondrial-like isoform X2 [Oncorhynchus nerka]|uniref:pentatricopeptide repeat-containing protein 2, mitochondrial-like isoform X2 n=1 Tax=Oncorhynchus nerka TaxID=8023 RepID=UPI0031B89C17
MYVCIYACPYCLGLTTVPQLLLLKLTDHFLFCRSLFGGIQSEAKEERVNIEGWPETASTPMPICRGHGHSQRDHEENSNVAFGEFKFGPPFMRLCYELGLEDMAAATLTDKSDVEKAQSIFGQIMSIDSGICQNLKVLMLAMAGAVKESLSVLTLTLGSSSPAFIKKPEFAQEVVDLVRLRSEDSPLMASVEQAVPTSSRQVR